MIARTLTACVLLALTVGSSGPLGAQATAKQPNILIIWGDDVGYWNISAYNQGMMGYKTPNIDRIAREGGLFTDYYGQQSCTAGRAAFITGQSPFRTGLLKVGLPGAKEGLQIAELNCDTPTGEAEAIVLGPLSHRHGATDPNTKLAARIMEATELLAGEELPDKRAAIV